VTSSASRISDYKRHRRVAQRAQHGRSGERIRGQNGGISAFSHLSLTAARLGEVRHQAKAMTTRDCRRRNKEVVAGDGQVVAAMTGDHLATATGKASQNSAKSGNRFPYSKVAWGNPVF
jgi:hypothetical protein